MTDGHTAGNRPADEPVRAATRTDVAARAGVSTAVVSYVINNGPRPVASATRKRVLEAMHALDYRPNAAARALRTRKATAVGLVVPDVSNTYFGSLARAITNQAFDAGFALLLGDSDNDPERQAAQIESLVGRQVDGLIVVSLEPSSPDDTRDVPTVYLDHRTQAGQASILVDNSDGARQAVEHLLAHRRRTIAHIAGPAGAPGADDRVSGWERTLRAADATAGLAFLQRAEFSREGGYEAGRSLLSDPDNRPDAVFVSSDVQALGLLRAARELHVAVPGDLAVISFDGTDDAIYSDPPLTAIEQPVDEIASAALSAVLSQGRKGPGRIPVRLVIRESCGSH